MVVTFPTRRRMLLAAAASLGLPLLARAQAFPSKPIRIIVGFGAGGTTDAVGRLYGQKLGELLGTPVIIENKPGANQITAINALKAAPPDGYTLWVGNGSGLVQNPAMRAGLPYDPLKDFTLVGMATTLPAVIFVGSDLPVRTVRELVAYGASHPGKLNYGSAGVGTAGHLHAEAFLSRTSMQMTHVPYKSDAEVIREVIAGNVHLGIMTPLNTMSFIKEGRIRALAVTTNQRLPYLPDVPGLSETGINGLSELEPYTFLSLVGPAGMPPAVVARLNEAINKVSATPDVAARMRGTLYAEPATSTPASFRAFLEKELAKWREVGKAVKLTD